MRPFVDWSSGREPGGKRQSSFKVGFASQPIANTVIKAAANALFGGCQGKDQPSGRVITL